MRRATTSLPTPLSPVMSTLALEREAHRTSCAISRIAALGPMSCGRFSKMSHTSAILIPLNSLLCQRLIDHSVLISTNNVWFLAVQCIFHHIPKGHHAPPDGPQRRVQF